MLVCRRFLHLLHIDLHTSARRDGTGAAPSGCGTAEQQFGFHLGSRIHFDFRGVGGLGLRAVVRAITISRARLLAATRLAERLGNRIGCRRRVAPARSFARDGHARRPLQS